MFYKYLSRKNTNRKDPFGIKPYVCVIIIHKGAMHWIGDTDVFWNTWYCFCLFMKRKFKLIVNNSTNINKTNNHLSPQLVELKKKKDQDRITPTWKTCRFPSTLKDHILSQKWTSHKRGQCNCRVNGCS